MLVVHLGQTKISELKGHTKLKVKLKYNSLKQTYNYIEFNYFLKIILLCYIIDKHIQCLSNNAKITKI